MSNIIEVNTKKFRGCGFMTIAKYNNKGDIIYVGDKDSKRITAIETENYTIKNTFDGHKGVIWSLDISADDSKLISCSGDMNVIIWDTNSGEKLKQINIKNIPKCITIQKNTNKNLIVIYCDSISKRFKSYINIYDLDEINNVNYPDGLIKSIEWNEISKPSIVTWLPNQININETNQNETNQNETNQNETNQNETNQNGYNKKLIIGCENGMIIIKDIEDDDYRRELLLHTNTIKSIVFDKSNSKFLTSSLDKTSKQVNINTFEILKTYVSTVPINYAIYNYNDRKVILAGGIEAMMVAKTGDNDLNIKFYRASDQKLISHILSHFGPVRFLDKSPNNKNFLSASQDGMLKIYLMNDINEDDMNNINKTDNNINKTDNNIIDNNKNILNIDTQDINNKSKSLTDEINRIEYLNVKINKSITVEPIKRVVVGMPEYNKSILEKQIDFEKKESNIYVPQIISSTIKISNLPNDIHPRELLEIYEFYGRIEERGIIIKTYHENTIAFIRFTSVESANKAIQATNGQKLNYCILSVELARNH